jgi:hypothetical protein
MKHCGRHCCHYALTPLLLQAAARPGSSQSALLLPSTEIHKIEGEGKPLDPETRDDTCWVTRTAAAAAKGHSIPTQPAVGSITPPHKSIRQPLQSCSSSTQYTQRVTPAPLPIYTQDTLLPSAFSAAQQPRLCGGSSRQDSLPILPPHHLPRVLLVTAAVTLQHTAASNKRRARTGARKQYKGRAGRHTSHSQEILRTAANSTDTPAERNKHSNCIRVGVGCSTGRNQVRHPLCRH